jgi:hypothetical protein
MLRGRARQAWQRWIARPGELKTRVQPELMQHVPQLITQYFQEHIMRLAEILTVNTESTTARMLTLAGCRAARREHQTLAASCQPSSRSCNHC